MQIEFDPAKRETTLRERGLDFADAPQVFAGPVIEAEDSRFDYGETRITSMGMLNDRLVVLVWTQRGEARRIISMRYANEREITRYNLHLGRSG